MKRLEYSPLVKRKFTKLRKHLLEEYASETVDKILQGMMDDADTLMQFEESGVNIAKLYNIDTEYWYLFTHQHYLIYRIEKEKVIIVQMFHEKEDFMMKLFGVSGRTQESIDYWGE